MNHPTITKKREKVLAFSCIHGEHADPGAVDAIIRMRDLWKPKHIICLGDQFDTACLRRGAKGGNDESRDMGPDMDAGLSLLRAIRPTVFCWGNHDWRPVELMGHHNAIIAGYAKEIVQSIESTLARLKCVSVHYSGLNGYFQLNDTAYTHGTIFNENAARDMAEIYATDFGIKKVVFGHTHTIQMAKARTLANGTGFNVGALTAAGNHDYSRNRRKTMSWSMGFLWGETHPTGSQLWLHDNGRNTEKKWRLPI